MLRRGGGRGLRHASAPFPRGRPDPLRLHAGRARGGGEPARRLRPATRRRLSSDAGAPGFIACPERPFRPADQPETKGTDEWWSTIFSSPFSICLIPKVYSTFTSEPSVFVK